MAREDDLLLKAMSWMDEARADGARPFLRALAACNHKARTFIQNIFEDSLPGVASGRMLTFVIESMGYSRYDSEMDNVVAERVLSYGQVVSRRDIRASLNSYLTSVGLPDAILTSWQRGGHYLAPDSLTLGLFLGYSRMPVVNGFTVELPFGITDAQWDTAIKLLDAKVGDGFFYMTYEGPEPVEAPLEVPQILAWWDARDDEATTYNVSSGDLVGIADKASTRDMTSPGTPANLYADWEGEVLPGPAPSATTDYPSTGVFPAVSLTEFTIMMIFPVPSSPSSRSTFFAMLHGGTIPLEMFASSTPGSITVSANGDYLDAPAGLGSPSATRSVVVMISRKPSADLGVQVWHAEAGNPLVESADVFLGYDPWAGAPVDVDRVCYGGRGAVTYVGEVPLHTLAVWRKQIDTPERNSLLEWAAERTGTSLPVV